MGTAKHLEPFAPIVHQILYVFHTVPTNLRKQWCLPDSLPLAHLGAGEGLIELGKHMGSQIDNQ